MNLKKIGLVLAFLLVSDLTFVGCSGTRQVVASVAPTAEQVEIASRGQISPYDPLLRQAAEEAGMDWRFLAAIACQESRFDPHARSHRGALGLMQVMESVANGFGVAAGGLSDTNGNI